MLAKRAILNTLLKKNTPTSITQVATHATGNFHDERLAIGNREWVGYGLNGQPHYVDRPDFPMPAIRFQEIKGDLIVIIPILYPLKYTTDPNADPCKEFHPHMALREKEKGDWKNLTIDEKKKLYRASFCQTLVEADAPTGQWKSILGFALMGISGSLCLMLLMQKFIYRPKPPTFSEEHRAATLRTMIDLKQGHITGVSSKWDYEKDDWKK